MENPRAILALVGRAMPMQIVGEDDVPIRTVDETVTEKEMAGLLCRRGAQEVGLTLVSEKVGDERIYPLR